MEENLRKMSRANLVDTDEHNEEEMRGGLMQMLRIKQVLGESLQNALVNIMTGTITTMSANVDITIDIG
ncbi:hypothetical protein DPMN_182805 [Dreissena polymorpha]|uniref:Uncharacterized protein n=1 Tax=Dreissena polymorpha TaxID=45954 RepID=A0A9D4I302_DREPO|nr:hypothetical protein DPMN_182805 [Dreissena polymorpha]